MLGLIKEFIKTLWDNHKKDIIYLSIVIIMVCWAISSMNACTNQLQESKRLEHNLIAQINDIEYYKGKNEELVAQQQIFIASQKELELLNEDLSNQLKSMKVKNVEQALRIEGLINNPPRDTVWHVNNDTIYIDKSVNITNPFDFSNEYRVLQGNAFISDGNLGLNIDKDIIKFDYTAAFKDGQLYITSDNPYVQYSNITGVQMPKQKKKRWNIGIYGGFGIHYDMPTKSFGYGPQLGGGVSIGF